MICACRSVGPGGSRALRRFPVASGSVALARTLVTEPSLVLLDEPLGALDANLRARMRGELGLIRERCGVTFLHVTGSESEALAMGDMVLVLDSGRIAQAADADTIYNRPKSLVGSGLPQLLQSLRRPARRRGLPRALRCASHSATSRSSAMTARVTPSATTVSRSARPKRRSAPDEVRIEATFVADEYSGAAVSSFFSLDDGRVFEVESHLSRSKPPVRYAPAALRARLEAPGCPRLRLTLLPHNAGRETDSMSMSATTAETDSVMKPVKKASQQDALAVGAGRHLDAAFPGDADHDDGLRVLLDPDDLQDHARSHHQELGHLLYHGHLSQRSVDHRQDLVDRCSSRRWSSATRQRSMSVSSSRTRRSRRHSSFSASSFWTSFLIRVLAWRPMLRQGGRHQSHPAGSAASSTSRSRCCCFPSSSVIIGMTQIYCVFMGRAYRLHDGPHRPERHRGGAGSRCRLLAHLPHHHPAAHRCRAWSSAAIFVSVMVLGEFATAAALSGRKVNLLGNIIVTQVGSLKWAFAAVVGVVPDRAHGHCRRRRCCASSTSGRSSEPCRLRGIKSPRHLHRRCSRLSLRADGGAR